MFLVPQLFFFMNLIFSAYGTELFFQPYFNDPYFIKGHCILLCFIRKYIVTSEVTVSLCNSNSVVGRANVFIILSTNRVISLREPDYSQRLKKKYVNTRKVVIRITPPFSFGTIYLWQNFCLKNSFPLYAVLLLLALLLV